MLAKQLWLPSTLNNSSPEMKLLGNMSLVLLDPWLPHLLNGAAAGRLKNGQANGHNGIPNELVNYLSNSVHERFASIINRSFDTNCYLDPIGQAM